MRAVLVQSLTFSIRPGALLDRKRRTGLVSLSPCCHATAWRGACHNGTAAAAQAIGFPDLARDADLLSRSRRTASGGWVVQLTDAPLDLDNPAHLDALKRAYERFPEIGGRSAP